MIVLATFCGPSISRSLYGGWKILTLVGGQISDGLGKQGRGRFKECIDEWYAVLTKCEVKIAGYWPLAIAFLWTEIKSQGKWKCRKEQGQYPASQPKKLGQWQIFYVPKKQTFSCKTNAGNPEQARQAHLVHSGSQSEHRICFILPSRRFSHIIIGWFSNRTGTSDDDSTQKLNNWLDKWQTGKLGTGLRV